MTGTWAHSALCRQEGLPTDWDDALDIEEGADSESVSAKEARHERAKAVCRRCPVRSECMTYALTLISREIAIGGIWFGEDIHAWRRGQQQRRSA